jgi:hypothetical protein
VLASLTKALRPAPLSSSSVAQVWPRRSPVIAIERHLEVTPLAPAMMSAAWTRYHSTGRGNRANRSPTTAVTSRAPKGELHKLEERRRGGRRTATTRSRHVASVPLQCGGMARNG